MDQRNRNQKDSPPTAYFDIHGLRLSVESLDSGFLEYACDYLNYFHVSAGLSNVDIRVSIHTRSSARSKAGKGACELGSDVYVIGNEVRIVASGDRSILCQIIGSDAQPFARLTGTRHLSLPRRLLDLLSPRGARRTQAYMSLLRQCVVLPVLATVAHVNGWSTLHASVVARDGQAIVLAGLNGSGKSALAWYLVREHGYRIVSDNFAILDSSLRDVYCFPEVIRLNLIDDALNGSVLRRTGHAFGKDQYVPAADIVAERARVSCVAAVQLGPTLDIRTTSGAEMATHLEALHRYLAETPDHAWTQLYRHLTQPTTVPAGDQTSLSAFCNAGIPFLFLTIPKGATDSERYSGIEAAIGAASMPTDHRTGVRNESANG